ncbi:MAG: hypothetical protein ACAI44_00110 [Candidatus Sericytochromatia bacterium]
MPRLCQTLLLLLILTTPAIPARAADGPGKPYLAAEPLGGQHDGTTLGGGMEADLGTASADPAPADDLAPTYTQPADNAPNLNDTQATDPNDLESSRSTTLATVMLTLIAAGIAAGVFAMHRHSQV